MSQYVGVDLHRRRSQVVILDESGERLSSVRVSENSPAALAGAVGRGGSGTGGGVGSDVGLVLGC